MTHYHDHAHLSFLSGFISNHAHFDCSNEYPVYIVFLALWDGRCLCFSLLSLLFIDKCLFRGM